MIPRHESLTTFDDRIMKGVYQGMLRRHAGDRVSEGRLSRATWRLRLADWCDSQHMLARTRLGSGVPPGAKAVALRLARANRTA